jgi:hypothetical protein
VDSGRAHAALPACAADLAFPVQLGPRVAHFGDTGVMYVFACPNGCTATAAVQCH